MTVASLQQYVVLLRVSQYCCTTGDYLWGKSPDPPSTVVCKGTGRGGYRRILGAVLFVIVPLRTRGSAADPAA